VVLLEGGKAIKQTPDSTVPWRSGTVYSFNWEWSKNHVVERNSRERLSQGKPKQPTPVVPERRIPRDDEDDDSDDERQHKKPKLKDSDSETQRLACLYFKRNPSLYRHWRSCPGPGWRTVHRVKCDFVFSHVCQTRWRFVAFVNKRKQGTSIQVPPSTPQLPTLSRDVRV